jgi:hypothetical protein
MRARVTAMLVALAPLGALAPLMGGCSTGGLLGSSGDAGSPSLTDRFSGFFSGPASPTATQAEAGATTTTDIDCPSIDVRQGAGTLSVNATGREAATGAEGLRYQVTIGRTARECALVGGNMRMKVGVQGRVILGPAGGPGPVEVPLRYAVVQEGPSPKTIVTQLFRVPVAVAPDQTTVPFVHVDEDLTFPMPKRQTELDAYVIYIGFDPDVPKAAAPRAPRKAKKKAAQ